MDLNTILDPMRKVTMSEDFYYKNITKLDEQNRFDLKKWNMIQKKLWQHLVQDGIVSTNNANAFYEFGKYFKDFYDEHGRVLSYSELLKYIAGY